MEELEDDHVADYQGDRDYRRSPYHEPRRPFGEQTHHEERARQRLGDEGLVERLVEFRGILLNQRLQVPEYEVSQAQDHQSPRYPAGTPTYGVGQEQTEDEGGEEASQSRGRLLPTHHLVRDEHREPLTPQHQVRCCPHHDQSRQHRGDKHATVAAQGTRQPWRLHCRTPREWPFAPTEPPLRSSAPFKMGDQSVVSLPYIRRMAR